MTALRRLAAVQLSENNIPQLEALAERLIRSPGGAAIGYTLRGVVAHNIDRAISQIRERSKPARNPKDPWPRYAL